MKGGNVGLYGCTNLVPVMDRGGGRENKIRKRAILQPKIKLTGGRPGLAQAVGGAARELRSHRKQFRGGEK